jgi:hypothetical protein
MGCFLLAGLGSDSFTFHAQRALLCLQVWEYIPQASHFLRSQPKRVRSYLRGAQLEQPGSDAVAGDMRISKIGRERYAEDEHEKEEIGKEGEGR